MPELTPISTLADVAMMTAGIVSAYVANNRVPAGDLPDLIRGVHAAVGTLSGSEPAPVGLVGPLEPPKPAVPVKKSVGDDYIICLDDGRRMKSLKRHLAALGMTPAEYRAKWALPPDYPMVAPAYARARSELAKRMGLGRLVAQTAE